MHPSLPPNHGETPNASRSRSRSRQRARTEVNEHRSVWDRLNLQKLGSWLKKEGDQTPPLSPRTAKMDEQHKETARPHSSGGLLGRRNSKRVVPGLSRPLTFKKMQSEKRDKVLEVPVEQEQRRAASVDCREPPSIATITAPTAPTAPTATTAVPSAVKRSLSPPPVSALSVSAPDLLSPSESNTQENSPPPPPLSPPELLIGGEEDSNIPPGSRQVDYGIEERNEIKPSPPTRAPPPPPLPLPVPLPQTDVADARSIHSVHSVHSIQSIQSIPSMHSMHSSHHSHMRSHSDIDDLQLQEELEAKWILNLSMHFRDMSDREKFFITYAEEPNKWRRVTVSCDYRRLEPDSLEADLKSLHYQRDKSSRIYEAIRDSLPDIQFYDTVTNLKLETADGRLHVHVTEDVNEIIPYPSSSAINHLHCRRFTENAVSFDSHISGFVYKVSVEHRTYIKKEIPGPDAVEEFLYEINALSSLGDAKSVIKFEGVIVDDHNQLIKGLLISYAEQGALVDMIYDFKPTGQLHWERRERWARQIVEGLSEIHEAGFVQGDFTLSNIVIDENDDAKIIDINRRGCPVGWEPPELARLIESGQRISIYIGVKSDLYQLGMVLWAIAEQHDEPERQDRPLVKLLDRPSSEVPEYFKDIIRACLSDSPRDRPSAANLLKRFPDLVTELGLRRHPAARESVSSHRSDKEYIDPATAVDLNDISQHRRHSRQKSSFENVTIPPTEYPASSGSYIIPGDRGRSRDSNSRNRRSDCSPYPGHRSVMSLDDSELENELASLPASRETRWEQIYIDGDTKLVQRGCADIDVHDFATQEPKDICITSPPAELENSFLRSRNSIETPLSLSTVVGPQPAESRQQSQEISQEPGEKAQHHDAETKASFSDRVHQLAQSQTQHVDHVDNPHQPRRHSIPNPTVLADLENDIAMDSSVASTSASSRVSTGFSIFDPLERATRVGAGFSLPPGFQPPFHQDSGFSELERIPTENEIIRHSLDGSIQDIRRAQEEEDRIKASLWDGMDDAISSGKTKRKKPQVQPKTAPVLKMVPASPLKAQEKMASPRSSSPPPPPSAPIFGTKNVLSVEDVKSKAIEEKTSNTTIRPPSILIPDYHHGLPKAAHVDNSTHTSPSGTSSVPMYSAREHQHPYYDDDPFVDDDDDEKNGGTDDLSDYLSHTISYSHHPDLCLPAIQPFDPKASREAKKH